MVAEHDVLGDGERLDEPEVLVHHADPGVDPVARGVEGDGLAVDLELALVGAVEAGEDVRERALAGAVLAEQRVHLALERLEVDAVVRDDAGEALRDPAARDRRARAAARRGDRSATPPWAPCGEAPAGGAACRSPGRRAASPSDAPDRRP